MPKAHVEPNVCFLNVPYDEKFENLYLAYIVGLTAFGLVLRATLGVPRHTRRLERIFDLIKTCNISVHDLSRIELDRNSPRAPRFNMPFELGLAVAWTILNPQRHTWIGCDAVEHRPLKSISDLNGTDTARLEGSLAHYVTPLPLVPKVIPCQR